MFVFTTLLGSFLLFVIQPHIAKSLLPIYGGAPAVWITVSMFFQTALLIGYSYAHFAFSHRNKYYFLGVHFTLCLLSVISLFVLEVDTLNFSAQNPIIEIITNLSLYCLLSAFLLASTSPLVQRLYADHFPDRSPYWLYAASNVGSLVGLLCFPIILERYVGLNDQREALIFLYLVFVILSFKLLITKPHRNEHSNDNNQSNLLEYLTTKNGSLVLFISMMSSVLLLATTNKLCFELVSLPLLWVLPTSLYLCSFIVTFRSRAPSRVFWLIGTFLSALLLILLPPASAVESAGKNILLVIAEYLSLLFFACGLSHQELYRLRPDAKQSTCYYLVLSLGGCLGGIFTSIVAPQIFNGFYELPIALISLPLIILLSLVHSSIRSISFKTFYASIFLLMAVFAISLEKFGYAHEQIAIGRNFYGTYRVHDASDQNRIFVHGNTIHGSQHLKEEYRNYGTTYFCKGSGGEIILNGISSSNKKVGIIGLGVGTLATYGKDGDEITFYELDPEIESIARKYFTFLEDSKASIKVITGDGRQALKSQPSQNYDLLILDGFTSDSVPVHLLTLEAFSEYKRHLKSNGSILVNISNRYLNFNPLLASIAKEASYGAFVISDDGKYFHGCSPSTFILLSNTYELINNPIVASSLRKIPINEVNFKAWTDNYSNVFSLLF